MKWLPLLLLLLFPASAEASLEAVISHTSPASSATSGEDVTYSIDFSEPISGLERGDIEVLSPPGTWTLSEPWGSGRNWFVALRRDEGGGDGELQITLLAESVVASGAPGPESPVSSPLLRIDTAAPTGAGFLWDVGESALRGASWQMGETWSGREWQDAESLGGVRVALSSDGIYSWNGSWTRRIQGGAPWAGVAYASGWWWAIRRSGELWQSADGQQWQDAGLLPGDWADLEGRGDELWALRSDGAVWSFQGAWEEKRASSPGTWVDLHASPSAVLIQSAEGQTDRLGKSWRGVAPSPPGEALLRGGGWWWLRSAAGEVWKSRDGGLWESVDLSARPIRDWVWESGDLLLLRDGVLGGTSLLRLYRSEESLPGEWQIIVSDERALSLLGPSGEAHSWGEMQDISASPELLETAAGGDDSSWFENITRSSSPLEGGQCSAAWERDWIITSVGEWPRREALAEDRCYRYERMLGDAAGNESREGSVFALRTPPRVLSFARTWPQRPLLSRADVLQGIRYEIEFSEPVSALPLSAFAQEGTAGGSWSGERSSTDRKRWQITFSSAEASSGTLGWRVVPGSVADDAGTAGPEQAARTSLDTLDQDPPPPPSWSATPPAIISSNFLQLAWSPGEAGGEMLCGELVCSSPHTWSGLSDGTHTLRVRHRDAAGNISAELSHTVLVDTTPPLAPSITSYPERHTTSRSASVTWQSGEETECRLGQEEWQACTSPWTRDDLLDGEYTLLVRARDAAGNTSPAAEALWTVDTTPPPSPEIESGPPGASPSSSAFFVWMSDGLAECRLRRDGVWGEWDACASPYALTLLRSGYYLLEVRQRDAAGNVSPATSWSWQIILEEPPRPLISSGPESITSSRSAEFSFSSPEPGDFECLLEGDWQPCSSPFRVSGLGDGSRTFQVRQINGAGLSGPAALWSWTIDGTPPALPLVDSTPPPWTSARVSSFAWRGEIGATSLCALDGGAWEECSSIWEIDNPPEGERTWRLRLRDQAGNLSPTWEHSWRVDRTPPAPPLWLGGPSGPTGENDLVFLWSGEEGALYQCSLDEAPWDECSPPFRVRFAVAGSHSLRVRQIDRAGNVSQAAERNWVIDLADPPRPEIIDRPRTWSRDRRVSFSWIPLQGNTSECFWSGAWQKCRSPYEVSVTEGSQVFRVRQVKPSGRRGKASVVRWTADFSRPLLRSLVFRRSKKKLFWRASDQLSPLQTVQFRPGGTWKLQRKIPLQQVPRSGRVCDAAGNCSAWMRVRN